MTLKVTDPEDSQGITQSTLTYLLSQPNTNYTQMLIDLKFLSCFIVYLNSVLETYLLKTEIRAG
jgi:hypothetical protein